MFGFTAPRQKSGRPVLAPAVDRPAREAARQSRSRPGPGLAGIESAGAMLVRSTVRRPWAVRITAVGTSSSGAAPHSVQLGAYGWQAIAPDPAAPGNYRDIPGWAGTLTSDPAWELNDNPSLAIGTRAIVDRDYASGLVQFQLDRC